ncbi:MAG: signal peptide peptidase SppA [Pseudomonadota bacterium]
MTHEHKPMTIWSFLKGLFKIVIGFSLFIQSLLFLILLIFVIGIVSTISVTLSGKADKGPSISVPEGAALVLNPEGVLVETAPPVDPFEEALAGAFGGPATNEVSVHELVAVIRAAKNDTRIEALVLDLQALQIPPIFASKAHYLASEVEAFRESGKPVVAIADAYTQEQYLIASEANDILMHDLGMVLMDGYGRYRTYFKSALDRLKVNSHIFRVGTFKSALEPYIRDDMSEAAKTANQAYLNVLWTNYTNAIDANRGLAPGSSKRLVNTTVERIVAAGGNAGQAALQAGFVDQLMARAEQIQFITNIVGPAKDDSGGFLGVPYSTYRISMPRAQDRQDIDNIAVVTAAGPIVDGDEPYGVAAGDIVAGKLRAARVNDAVKAVVLRVDSPGGSAFASEIIRDEVLELKAAGKPVIVSMGSLAASGGYWISANADEIWAAPTTVTGSIGVFGFVPTLENTMADLGVNTDGVGTTPLSGIAGAGLGPLPEAYSAIIQASVEEIYDRFLSVVASGRDLSPSRVDQIGQGRVWIGQTARGLSLVDQLGDLDDAITSAAEKAGLEDYDVTGLRNQKSRFEAFLEQFAGADMSDLEETDMTSDLFGAKQTPSINIQKVAWQVWAEAKFLSSFNDPNAVYLRCIECIDYP